MEFIRFQIKNFRGARDVTIDLERKPRSQVYTLVGLNESGKTTVLEAISHMGRTPYDLRKTDPSQSVLSTKDYQSFIPVPERYNFSGSIQLIAHLRIGQECEQEIKNFIERELGFKVVHLDPTFRITKTLSYKDSNFEGQKNLWTLVPSVRKKTSKKAFDLLTQTHNEEWLKLSKFVEPMIPQVLYFKNEIFDFPDRIYISGKGDEDNASKEINKFYCEVLQDILFAIDPQLSLDTHIKARKKSNSSADKQNLAGLLQKMGHHITHTVMKQWETIFGRRLKDKRIQVVCEISPAGQIYLQLKLEDGGEVFDINERSTGFRWFFVFILLTHYRGYRNEAAIFLYDEPASNLHSSAQRHLLDCFAKLPRKFTVIYSTHSHYLINPEWLDNTMVIRNEGIEYEDSLEDFGSAKTDIKLLPYRKFVSDNPSGISYFQPILDVLQHTPSRLELIRPPVLVEGKGDFYVLSYMTKICLDMALPFDLIPCMGSGTMDQLIALYAGWGKKFFVLLDSDSAGKGEKKRYLDKFGSLVHDRVICYRDIYSGWDKFALEKIVGEDALEVIHEKVFSGIPYKKEKFHFAVQELLATKAAVKLPSTANEAIVKIASYLAEKLDEDNFECTLPVPSKAA